MENDRIDALTSRLFEYVRSPSLKHIRDPYSINRLARDLLTAVDRASSIWGKWDGPREQIAKSAAYCWIPAADLRAYLNRLPGPTLAKTDVVQRLRALCEQPYSQYPNEDVEASCLALYESEKSQGTEMPAIIGLQEHIEAEEDRLNREREEAWRRQREEERLRKRQLFEAGADSGWTQLDSVEGLHCRRNRRTYRATQGKDKRWSLFRVKAVGDAGALLGPTRTGATQIRRSRRLRSVPSRSGD